MHGGANPKTAARAAVRAEVAAWTLGQAVDDPGEVLLRLVTQSRIRADRYATLIAEKIEDLAPGTTIEDILIGDTIAVSEFGGDTKTGEYIRGLIQLENQERDRLATFATKAIAAGLAERQVRLAERQGALLAQVMVAVMTDPALGFTDQQREAMPRAIEAHLAAVAG
ncbi:hypothetical protein LQK89_02675 [Curtobacterium sp. C1]|nr:hypothetical protein [Curtobacterium sp. C1]UFU14623.1 hypothetical protein LQK89_02675 [Curtobacterium sp. C1]